MARVQISERKKAISMSSEVVAVGPVLSKEFADALRAAFVAGNCTALVEQIQLAIRKTVTGVILYGGMAREPVAAELGESDVDLLVLVDEPASGGIFGSADGIQIDLHIQHRNQTISDPHTNWIYAEGRPLFDSRPPELALWLEQLTIWKQKNADPWSEVDHLRSRVWAQRLAEKIVRLSGSDPTIAALHEARLLAALPTLHAQVKRIRTTSIGKWWRTVQTEDPALASALARYISRKPCVRQYIEVEELLNELYRST
jgi:hypothetical protein